MSRVPCVCSQFKVTHQRDYGLSFSFAVHAVICSPAEIPISILRADSSSVVWGRPMQRGPSWTALYIPGHRFFLLSQREPLDGSIPSPLLNLLSTIYPLSSMVGCAAPPWRPDAEVRTEYGIRLFRQEVTS